MATTTRRLAGVAALALALAACDGDVPTPPTTQEPTVTPGSGGEWIEGTEVTISDDYVEDGGGDLHLRSLRVTTTADGSRVDLATTGTSALGWRLVWIEDVMDASPFFSVDLSGFANPHPFLILSASNPGFRAGTGSTSDTVVGFSASPNNPVDYRWEMASPQELSVEFAATVHKVSAGTVVPWPPEPEPWEGLPLTDPAETLRSDAWGTTAADGNALRLMGLHTQPDVYELELGFNEADAPEWEAHYVNVALHPVTDEPLPLHEQAILLVTLEGVTEPAEILDGVSTGNDDCTAVVTTDGDTTQIWLGLPSAAPFQVVEDGSTLHVVAER